MSASVPISVMDGVASERRGVDGVCNNAGHGEKRGSLAGPDGEFRGSALLPGVMACVAYQCCASRHVDGCCSVPMSMAMLSESNAIFFFFSTRQNKTTSRRTEKQGAFF